jgi:cytochrome c553
MLCETWTGNTCRLLRESDMSTKAVLFAVFVTLVGGLPTAVVADVDAGKKKYVLCAGCHGPTGSGNEALKYPRLSGRDAAFVAQQLRAFKSGGRDNATMKAMVAGLSEQDIDNLAAYIATLR